MLNFKLFFTVSLYCFITSPLVSCGDITIKKAQINEVIYIKIPQVIYKQAFDPTPILKSSATIVLPIHVSQEDENIVDDDELENEEIVENFEVTTLATNDVQVIEDVVTAVNSTAAADVTQKPTTQKPTTQTQVVSTTAAPDEEVSGEVFRFPCTCKNNECSCCTGTILERIRMKACGRVAFKPEDFVFDVRMTINNNTVLRRRVSASDPPPICFNPRRAPFVQVCLEISNIRIRNRNIYACLDITADIAGFQIYSASFKCFGLGSIGVKTGLKPKPVSSGPKPISLFGNTQEESGGFLQNAAGTIFGRPAEGLFGQGGFGDGLFGGGGSDAGGPLDAIGDAVGDFFEGRNN